MDGFGLKSPSVVAKILFGIDEHLVFNSLPHALVGKLGISGSNNKSVDHNHCNQVFKRGANSGEAFKNTIHDPMIESQTSFNVALSHQPEVQLLEVGEIFYSTSKSLHLGWIM